MLHFLLFWIFFLKVNLDLFLLLLLFGIVFFLIFVFLLWHFQLSWIFFLKIKVVQFLLFPFEIVLPLILFLKIYVLQLLFENVLTWIFFLKVYPDQFLLLFLFEVVVEFEV